MKSSNQCVFVSELFRRLLGTAIIVLIVGGLFHTRSAEAEAISGNYSFKNDFGLTVVPLPEGKWRKIHEEIWNMDGSSRHTYTYVPIQHDYLVRVSGKKITALLKITTLNELGGGDGWESIPFCSSEEVAAKFKWHETPYVFEINEFCLGVRYVQFSTDPAVFDPKLFKSIKDRGLTPHLGALATLVRIYKAKDEKFVDLNYHFFADTFSELMSWQDARDWAKSIMPRVEAGFEGKIPEPQNPADKP